LAINIIFAALSLILNYPGLKLAVAVYKGLPIGRSLPCVPYNPYVPVRSGDVARRRFWPVKAWVGSYIVEFNMPAYLGLYPSFLVFSPSYLGLKA